MMFVVLKFLPDNDDDSDIYYDIGLTKWLIKVNEDMEGETYWPPHNVEAGNLVRKEVNADETWLKYHVHIKRYHDSEGEKLVKKSTKAVASPPNVQLSSRSDFYDSVPSCSHFNESQEKKLNIKVYSNKSQRIQQTPFRSDVKGKALLVQNVLDARKKTAEQFQKKMSLQSLSSNKVNNNTNSLKKQSQKHQIELMHMSIKKSKYNKQTSSDKENYKVTEKSNNKDQQSEKFSQSLSNIEKNSDFESSLDFIHSTEDSVANYKAVQKHMNIPSETGSNFEHIDESQQFCSNTDEMSQKSFSTTSARDNKTQDLELQLLKMDRKLNEINYKIDTVIMNQGKLNRSLLPQEKKRLKPHNMPSSLPLTNENDIQAIEKWLLCDAENSVALCDYLTSFGSTNDEKKAATTIMQKVMYNSVAKNYNFDGHGEKIGFKTLNLWTIIEGALSLKFPDSDLDIAFKTIKSWLRNASGRKQEKSNGSNNH